MSMLPHYFNEFQILHIYIHSQFNWLTYSQTLFTLAGVSGIDTTEPIIVTTPSYFEELSAVYNSADPM